MVVGAGLGALTNLVTGDGRTWSLVVAALGLVGCQAGLSVWQGWRAHQDRCAARDALLAPLRLVTSAASGQDERATAVWLTPTRSPTSLWARDMERNQLVAWCARRDPADGVVRVLTGPAGVGKSRLGLAVADTLPAGWVTGRLVVVDGLVERIVAAGAPTLVVVDDADREPGLDALISQAARHADLVRVLLITRSVQSLHGLVASRDLVGWRGIEVSLCSIGADDDRARWYGEAVAAYAKALGVPPPDVAPGSVGRDEDTLLVLHARALLAVTGPAATRELTVREIADELITREQHHWGTAPGELPPGCGTEVLSEALAVLLLIPAATPAEAADLLRRVPQYSHDAAQESRFIVARWIHRRYPPGPDHRPTLQPDLVAERLVATRLIGTPQLRHRLPVAALTTLTHACATFPEALPILAETLESQGDRLPEALAAVLDSGITNVELDRTLATLPTLIRSAERKGSDTLTWSAEHKDAPTLTALLIPEEMIYLTATMHAIAVSDLRYLAKQDPARSRADLARALKRLGTSLQTTGRPQEALSLLQESAAIGRDLVAQDRDTFLPALAGSLINLGICLRQSRRVPKSVKVLREAVAIHRTLAEQEPDRYRPSLARSLTNLGPSLLQAGKVHDALLAMEEAVAIRRALAEQEPDDYQSELARSLTNFATNLTQVGRQSDAVAALKEAVAIRRALAEQGPDRYRPDLALSLLNLGSSLAEIGQVQQAVTIGRESVAIRRTLAERDLVRHRPGLALSLTSLGMSMRDAGQLQNAMDVVVEAVAHWRTLAKWAPDHYRPDLAIAIGLLAVVQKELGQPRTALPLIEEAVAIGRAQGKRMSWEDRYSLAGLIMNLGAIHKAAGNPRAALTALEEAVAMWRPLADRHPDRASPGLAHALTNLGIVRHSLDLLAEATAAHREALTVWKACAARDPELHGSAYRSAAARYQRLLNRNSQSIVVANGDLAPIVISPPNRPSER